MPQESGIPRWMLSFSHKNSKGIFIADFTTHGGSHMYGLTYPSEDSLDLMDHFCTFDVSNIIPKNMHYLLYATFKLILTYITLKPTYIGMCAKGQIVL